MHAIESVAQQAISASGHVDVLVNNAGYSINGAIEEVTEQEFEPVMQTNLYGTIRTTRAFFRTSVTAARDISSICLPSAA